MTDKESERLDNIPEVAEKLKLGRRRFLKRLAIAALLGASGVLREKAEACPCPCDGGCDSCDTNTCSPVHTCTTDVCNQDTCFINQCTTDICNQDTCEHRDECYAGGDTCTTDTCKQEDQCTATNQCATNQCTGDICNIDLCTVDDECTSLNKCEVKDTDCEWTDISCVWPLNSCDID